MSDYPIIVPIITGLFTLVSLFAIVCVVWVWQNVIARVRYRREAR
jgi:hypothetical protein